MRFSDLQELFQSITVEILCSEAGRFPAGSAVRVRKPEESGTEAYLYLAGVEGVQGRGRFATMSYAAEWSGIQDRDYLACVTSAREGRLTVAAVTGFLLRRYDRTLEIAVTDSAFGKERKKDFGGVKRRIEEEYVLTFGGTRYIAAAKHMRSEGTTFSIVNGTRMYAVTESTRRDCGAGEGAEASQQIFAITRGEAPFRKGEYSVELWACGLKACNATSAAQADREVKAHISKGLARYLELWRQYTQVEYDFIRKTGERAGALEYVVEERRGRDAELTVKNPFYRENFLRNLDELGSGRGVVLPRRMVWDHPGKPRRKPGLISGTLISAGERNRVSVRFRTDEACYAIAPSGLILPDLRAAEMQYERRENAFKRVFHGKSAKPELALLISGEGGRKQEKRRLSALSETVIRECFPDHPPTPNQRKAIEIALNTPDFAIIQGPPGTGKTTVINAIMVALSEKEKNPELFFGKNLLTAYQKDATAHLAEKLRIYGLPVITYKGRFSRRADGEDAGTEEDGSDAAVSAWIQEKREALAASDGQAARYAEMDALAGKLKLLRLSFEPETASREACRSLLLACREDLLPFRDGEPSWLADQYLPRTEALLRETEAEIQGDPAAQARLRLDRQAAEDLPISPASMEDGGTQAVAKAARRFSGGRYPEMVRKIAAALETEYRAEEIQFRRVRILKNRLLSELRVKSGLLSSEKLNQKAADLLEDIAAAVERSERSAEDRIMADYIGAFADEEGIQTSIKEFLTVISATHQKAVSQEVRKMKGDEDVVFENVLIDEAARSCPPDLLIPLSCARDRMILVGDHRQLPQFVSDQVYDAIDAANAQAEAEKRAVIKDKPMFLHLIEQVRKLERDGVERFIQLDAQFRMPQTLGDLVSECFYEKDGGRKVKSPRGNEGFETGLKYIKGCHLVWLDVPGRAGEREEKNESGSYVRTGEALRIVNMLRSIIRDSGELGKKYKYGIMAFYRGQTELLEKMIYEDRFLQGLRSGGVKIDVGTVDAFQGLEYDVVFLSVVRSSTDYTSQKKRYGFTTDEHRLCVALSRAMRCMIIAGDSQMMQGKLARSAVPALVKFYEKCVDKEVPDARIYKDQEFLYQKAEGED